MSTYKPSEVCVFSKAKEQWGEFGNMTGGFKFRLALDILIPSTENLYQMMRFIDYPEIQREILDQKSGMGAKMISKKYRNTHTFEEFEEFEEMKIDIMLWCLKLKLLNHRNFQEVLLRTGDRDIVEFSKKDDFWGALPVGDTLVGQNVLGELLMILRSELKQDIDNGTNNYKLVEPPLGLKLFGKDLPVIDLR